MCTHTHIHYTTLAFQQFLPRNVHLNSRETYAPDKQLWLRTLHTEVKRIHSQHSPTPLSFHSNVRFAVLRNSWYAREGEPSTGRKSENNPSKFFSVCWSISSAISASSLPIRTAAASVLSTAGRRVSDSQSLSTWDKASERRWEWAADRLGSLEALTSTNPRSRLLVYLSSFSLTPSGRSTVTEKLRVSSSCGTCFAAIFKAPLYCFQKFVFVWLHVRIP